MSTADISKVLSSESRWRILTALSKGPRDVRSIVQEVEIQPTAVRYHIQSLLRLGLIESYEEKGGVGRPKVLFRLAKKQVTVGFPPRYYHLLSEIFINGLQTMRDQEAVRAALQKVGSDFGKNMMGDLVSKYKVGEWTPVQFDKYYVNVILPECGSQSETVKLNDRSIVFRSYTCPFQELALKYPEFICDIVHKAWLVGVQEVIGLKTDIKRGKCMGYGDEYCETSLEWPA